jgi:sigma-B regulation protein RsbQ
MFSGFSDLSINRLCDNFTIHFNLKLQTGVERPDHNFMNVLKRNNVKVTGKGERAIIFAHGFGCDQNMWRWVAPAFRESHKVILFDHVGAGQSDWSAYNRSKYSSLAGYAADLLDICEILSLRDAVFVGHSVSAMIGVLAALKEPSRFGSMVLVGPSPCYINDGEYIGGFSRTDIEGLLEYLDSNYLGWSSTMAPVIMGNPDQPELGAELTNSFCQADPEIAKQFARATFLSDNRSDLAQVKAKTLILQCSQDAIAPLEVGTYVHQQIGSSKMVVLNATGHCPNLSAPEETTDAIKCFLAEELLVE